MPEYAPALPRLDQWRLGRVVYFDTLESTNTVALRAGEDGLVVVAERQTAGRGRRGHSWSSAKGLGIWCSLCLEGPPEGLTFAAACALHGALEVASLKWPNDLVHEGRKLGGILVEHRAGWSALGFGINVLQRREDFPAELQEIATSLAMATGAAWDRGAVLQRVLEELAPRLQRLRAGGLRAQHGEWKALLKLEGRRLRRAEVEGVVEQINLDGSLCVATPGGRVTLMAGEMEWIEE